jgi:hypothetical protein
MLDNDSHADRVAAAHNLDAATAGTEVDITRTNEPGRPVLGGNAINFSADASHDLSRMT